MLHILFKIPIYAYMVQIYGYIAIYTLTHQASCINIYIYIYAVRDLIHHMQAIGAKGTCN